VHALCRSLATAGHDVHVLTTSVDGARDSDVPYDHPVELNGVQVHYCRSHSIRRLYWSADLAAKCRSLVGKFDAVHLHSVFLYPTRAGVRASVRAHIPYVLSPRGMLVRELIERRNAIVKRAWISFIERRNLAQAARIHLTSEEERRALADLDLSLAPTAVIPNGVEPPEPFLPETISADVRAIVSAGFDILSFGRINWKKGLDRLIRSISAMPKIRVVIAGHDEEGLSIELRRIAAEHGVEGRVLLLPRQITGADKEALYSAAALFVLPSLSENFGNVVAEAMVRGVPVVVSERVGAADIVIASGGGVVAAGTDSSFAAAILYVLESHGRLVAMGEAGARYAREQLSWDGIAHRFAEIYEEMAAEGTTARRHAQ
jgi:glycosyltransferase involved in cell wall biosynthesis